ncbi:MAG: isocitrate lyase/PEP mutase family protein [Pikeienuella sp.]
MTTKTAMFHALHVPGDPVILFNIWDPGSAAAVAAAGAKALATGSMPVALAHGFQDGEQMPRPLALDNIKRIAAATDLPVTADLEGGYDVGTEIVEETARLAIEAGAVGFNFEDQIVGGSGLHDIETQQERIKAARAGAPEAFLNARTDIFLKAAPETHDAAMLAEAIERAKAYRDAGASGFFAPGLVDEALIARLVENGGLPLNILAFPHAPPNARLAELGVARISYGPIPWKRMAAWLEGEARAVFEA